MGENPLGKSTRFWAWCQEFVDTRQPGVVLLWAGTGEGQQESLGFDECVHAWAGGSGKGLETVITAIEPGLETALGEKGRHGNG